MHKDGFARVDIQHLNLKVLYQSVVKVARQRDRGIFVEVEARK